MSGLDHLLRFLFGLLIALLLEVVPLHPQIAPLRPMWLPLLLAHAALRDTALPVQLAAFLTGLASDLLLGTPLGQQALTLVAFVYLLLRLRPSLTVLPQWQVALVLAPLWALYAFVSFWLDGVLHHPADPLLRWMPVASTALFWPLLVMVLGFNTVRRRPGPVIR
jgi:rod shape-determining protein MreD